MKHGCFVLDVPVATIKMLQRERKMLCRCLLLFIPAPHRSAPPPLRFGEVQFLLVLHPKVNNAWHPNTLASSHCLAETLQAMVVMVMESAAAAGC